MRQLFLLLTFVVASLFACSKKDKCEDVRCLNGGTCIDGSCACANGYTGERCQNAPIPPQPAKTFKITSFRTIDFPRMKDSGSSWDNSLTGANPPPDIYVKAYSGTTLFYESKKIDDVTEFTLPINSVMNPIFESASMSNSVKIELWDYDSINDEFMGSASFLPAIYAVEKPSTITFGTSGGAKFEVSVIWN